MIRGHRDQPAGWWFSAYALVTAHAVIGLLYIFQDAQRMAIPYFAQAKQIMPMPAWGVVFLASALLLGASCALGWRVQQFVIINALLATFWGFQILVSAAETHTTYTNGVLWLTVALCHYGLAFLFTGTPRR